MATETSGTIEFLENHQPLLPLGDYTLSVTQEISAENIRSENKFNATLKFSVLGPRFTLDPQEIRAVFPPAGSLGDHAKVLPHIILNRSTVPWERVVVPIDKGDNQDAMKREEDKRIPWLALLLFDEEEVKTTKVTAPLPLNLSDLKKQTGDPFPHWQPELGDQGNDTVKVIDVDKTLLQAILPARTDLKFLAHVRQTKDPTGKPTGEEVAIVIGNRLPRAGKMSTVHLVSLEGRYPATGDLAYPATGDRVRLISLTSWRFACVDRRQSFKGLLTHLNLNSSSTLRLPPLKSVDQASSDVAQAAESYFKMGCISLSHAMRQGNKTVSWYHGPLVPGSNTTPKDISLPVRSSDDLVCYNATHGMFDISYAAAWELGRLLALQSKSFSVSLYNWKRSHAQKIKDAEGQLAHLRLDGPAPSLDLPQSVSSWFEHLALLEGVPFNYLVPDERLLPPESIRFFQLDPMWMECLMDGAFSIGRVLKTDHEQDRSHRNQDAVNVSSPEKVSGFLLRSEVVAGWPGLQVDGYDEIPPDGSDAKGNLAFDFKNLKFTKKGFSHNDILAELQKELEAHKQLFSFEKATIENRQWSIFNHQGELQYRLNKRENNEIDVSSINDPKFLFSLDIGSETGLTAGKVTADLQQAFQAHTEDGLSSDSVISVTGWFVSDNKNHKHYWIEVEGPAIPSAACKVYRRYKLPLLRMVTLSKNVLLCLFDGIVEAIDLHLKPETLHFGVDVDPGTRSFSKKLRDAQGKDNSSIPVPQNGTAHLVISIAQMADDMRKELSKKDPQSTAFTSAEFALQMIEGVEKVRLTQH
jgi:hypothetical protein